MNSKILILLSLIISLSSCAKKQEADTAFSIDISHLYQQKVTGFSTPSVAIVQVYSPDVPQTSYFEKDCQTENCTAIEVEVPSSANTEIQVAILTSVGDEPDAFYYGEVTESLSANQANQIDVPLNQLSDFSNFSLWSGRISNSSGNHSSGELKAYLKVSGSSELAFPMLDGELIAGWFQLQLANGIPLVYRLNGESIFESVDNFTVPVTRDSLVTRALAASSDSSLLDFHLATPSFYEENINSGSGVQRKAQDTFVSYLGSTSVSGFCVDSQSSLNMDDSNYRWCTDNTCSTVLIDAPDNTGNLVSSHAANSLPLCSTDIYSNTHPIFRDQFKMREAAISGIQLPLQAQFDGSVYKYIDVDKTSTNNFSISGTFLPEVSTLISEVQVFALSTASALPWDDFCQGTNSTDITSIATLAVNEATQSFSGTANFDPSAFAESFLCFKLASSGQFMKTPIPFEPSSPAANLIFNEGTSYNFGTIANGSSNIYSLTLQNNGNSAASGLSASSLTNFPFNGGSYPGTGGDCGSTLAAGSSCAIVINMTPGATGTFNESLTITYNDGSTTQNSSIDLNAQVNTPALISISESDPYDYGTLAVGATAPHVFTVTNSGGVDATGMGESSLSGDFAFTGGAYPGTGGDCGTVLIPGNSCSLSIDFAPTTTGLQSATITVDYNNGVSVTSSTRSLQGTGAAPAVITISGSNPYDYGTLTTGSSATQFFTLTNAGAVTATSLTGLGLAAPYQFTGGIYPGTSGTCASSLTGGATCTIEVEFAPTATGTFNDTLFVDYNDGVAAQQASRDVTGSSP